MKRSIEPASQPTMAMAVVMLIYLQLRTCTLYCHSTLLTSEYVASADCSTFSQHPSLTKASYIQTSVRLGLAFVVGMGNGQGGWTGKLTSTTHSELHPSLLRVRQHIRKKAGGGGMEEWKVTARADTSKY